MKVEETGTLVIEGAVGTEELLAVSPMRTVEQGRLQHQPQLSGLPLLQGVLQRSPNILSERRRRFGRPWQITERSSTAQQGRRLDEWTSSDGDPQTYVF